MGKQSARIVYRGKDHKDIYFHGKYHNAMYVCKDGEKAELYWRKLYDEGYFVYTFSIFSLTNSYSTAIMYPKYKIREYHSLNSVGIYHSDKYFIRTPDLLPLAWCHISVDGKYWKKIDLSGLGSSIYFVIPKWNGIIICNMLDYYRNLMEYTYYPIKNGDIDREKSVMLYSDAEHGTQTRTSVNMYTNIEDMFILCDFSSGAYDNVSFGVDIEGNIHYNLFPVSYSNDYPANGYFNGIYWAMDRQRTKSADGYYHIYAYTTTDPSGEWKGKHIFWENAIWNYAVVQAEDYIVLYFGYNSLTAMQVYTTTDFSSIKQISIPDSLLVPIIGPVWDSSIKYVNIRLKPSAPTRSDSVDYPLLQMTFSDDIFRGRLNYVKNQKISPFEGLMLQTTQYVSATVRSQITIHIDNLFFEESEGNFAICEIYYPEQYMNDYIEEENPNVNPTI